MDESKENLIAESPFMGQPYETLAFHCDLCGRSFQSQQGLTMHKVRSHNQKPKHPKKKRRMMSDERAEQIALLKSTPQPRFDGAARQFRRLAKAELAESRGDRRLQLFELLLALEPFTY